MLTESKRRKTSSASSSLPGQHAAADDEDDEKEKEGESGDDCSNDDILLRQAGRQGIWTTHTQTHTHENILIVSERTHTHTTRLIVSAHTHTRTIQVSMYVNTHTQSHTLTHSHLSSGRICRRCSGLYTRTCPARTHTRLRSCRSPRWHKYLVKNMTRDLILHQKNIPSCFCVTFKSSLPCSLLC